MKRHLASAAAAAMLASVLLLPYVWPAWRWPWPLQWFGGLVSWSGLPAIMILALLGAHGGPDGMPDPLARVFATFMQWWVVLELGSLAWAARQVRNKSL